jgi:hypothetical protein
MVQSKSSDNLGEAETTEPKDWRTPLIHYLENHGHVTNRKVQREALKYVLLAHDLFHQTIDGLLLKWLGSDQSKIAMGEVHVEICSTHWLAYMR